MRVCLQQKIVNAVADSEKSTKKTVNNCERHYEHLQLHQHIHLHISIYTPISIYLYVTALN